MRIDVLDYGYVEFVEAWGTGTSGRDDVIGYPHDWERGIIEAARQSTQGSFRGWAPAPCDCHQNIDLLIGKSHTEDCASIKQPGDARLLAYLYNNQHATPFEFAGMVIEVQAPIFVFREWHRHRTQSYNEASARYAPLADLNYVPTIERIKAEGYGNKQAGAVAGSRWPMSDERAASFRGRLMLAYDEAQFYYQEALDNAVPKELARLVLPVGRYSKMRASANLRNWLAFMTLRCDPRAQWEIQQYANAVSDIIRKTFPQTHKLWSQT